MSTRFQGDFSLREFRDPDREGDLARPLIFVSIFNFFVKLIWFQSFEINLFALLPSRLQMYIALSSGELNQQITWRCERNFGAHSDGRKSAARSRTASALSRRRPKFNRSDAIRVQNCVLPRIVLTLWVAPNERLAFSRRALCLSTLTCTWDTALVVTLYSLVWALIASLRGLAANVRLVFYWRFFRASYWIHGL